MADITKNTVFKTRMLPELPAKKRDERLLEKYLAGINKLMH
jgi:hypothetical protein